ncbi:MAG: pyruvate dehydrogenase (acetyl-transferring) E1 component subunit alpha [candidate division NC10 bacterium]|nr:pyruvate dehydrogenase (acetyl-transferring) E1 component subunit alpha [candidate division NC10 bacterium]MBI2162887.1 pyruvate dehydrogenase (acetyl-transferring) E1 component subunit alpha [candidate division NC10 bacterium]MBI2456063.1 pyruvate dehydrogenase (acetyl-transferring) E1 component subunit alpha [candidate division NC10 bacterium]MBI2563606.1 pyruvate dehydrogenase (acetyl-transferring) E1 component subunit alpha [candidate division NC10 bacterium]
MARRSSKASVETAPEIARKPPMDKKVMVDLLYQMLLIRRFEEKAAEMYAQGKIGGFLHLGVGMEASCVGAISVLRPDDYVIAGYREHGHCLVRGSDPRLAMAELFGRMDGLSKGKGGSMHFFDKERNFLGGTGIVGGQLPIGTGVGFAINYRGGDQVCLCFFGDGSVAQGVFHESLNMASLWKLPVLYICENNLYAMGTALSRTQSVTDIYKKAEAYGMPGEQVDGMDVLAVREAVTRAVERARREKVPTLIETRTYRFRGHSMRDPAAALYRTREEVEEWKKSDPIVQLWDRLSRDGIISDADYKEMDKEINQVMEEAVRFAEASPEPPLEELLTDVFV